ncbi:MAG: PAS domain S-box protein [Methylobacter sp.]|nr:PAS domain S-box protein [Methylobacter sp.]
MSEHDKWERLFDLFGIKDFIPHGYCLSWSPLLLWLHVISDLLITLAYYSIPLMLVYFIRRRKDFPYSWLAIIFAGFIVACGTTHLLSAVTIWIPLYWLDGVLKAFTAIISIATAVLMLRVIPSALSAPSATQLQAEIEQRKTAEKALLVANVTLQKNIARTQLLLDSALDGIVNMDHNGKVIGWNVQAEHIFGYSSEQALGRKIAELIIPPAYRERHRQGLSRFMETDTSNFIGKRLELTGLRADASEFPMELTIGALKQNGNYFFSAYIRDISERRIAEDALRESEYRWKFAIEGSGDGVWDRDIQTDEVKYSSRWKEMLGYAEDDILPTRQDWLKRIHPDDQSYVAGVVQAYLEGNQATYVVEHRLRCKDGSYKWILARGSVVSRSEDGKPLRMIGTHTDISERKQAEQALRQSRKELQEAQRIAHMGSWQLDIATHHVAWSEELYRILGLNPELPAPDYTEYRRLFTPESWERLSTALPHTQETGAPYELELEMVRADGAHGWMLARGEAIQDSSGAIVGLHGVALDITERKVMEDELKTSETKFRSIIEVSPVPMALHDEQLNITFLNPAFVQTFGYSIDDIPTLADWWTKAYPDPDFRDWVAITWQTTLEKAKQEQTECPPMEVDIHCKNNSIKTVLVTAAAIHHDFTGMHLVMLYDITQRKQIEARLNSIFNASVEGIITTDTADIIVSANAAVETMFGYKPEQLVGCSINKLIQSSPKDINDYNFPHAVKGQIQEVEGIHNNGSVVPLDLSVAKFSIDNAHYFTHIVRDVSLRKYREQQDKEHLDELAHVTRLGLMGEMASGIAHEVNQPLAAISSYTQVSINLIHTENPDLFKLTEILYKTQQQALRAGRIIHRMREFVKSHSIHRSSADLNTLIHDAIGLCIAELKQNDIRLTFELENNLPPLYVDHIQIEQVIINLIRNSVEALQNLPPERQRHLTIHSHLIPNNVIRVRVKDNGPGLDEDQQQKILTPFYTTKADGMGLSISRSLIEAHEGTLHFNSKPGKGTTFYFTLPMQKKSE